MDQPRGVEGDRLVGGDVADHNVAAFCTRHREPLGERGRMADELEEDVAAATSQVAHGLRAGVPRGEVVDVHGVVGAEGPGELEALGDPVEDDDARSSALARDGCREEAEPAGSLDHDGLAGLKPGLVEAIDHLGERAVERRHGEIVKRIRDPSGAASD